MPRDASPEQNATAAHHLPFHRNRDRGSILLRTHPCFPAGQGALGQIREPGYGNDHHQVWKVRGKNSHMGMQSERLSSSVSNLLPRSVCLVMVRLAEAFTKLHGCSIPSLISDAVNAMLYKSPWLKVTVAIETTEGAPWTCKPHFTHASQT